ncbi:MAG: hypothetical protein GXP22_05220 [Gammaproteobacteria bacterium]|nr:hypothetical protein [Gammaproteobacteria bacterium]
MKIIKRFLITSLLVTIMPTSFSAVRLDVDGDGDADANDGLMIQRRLTGAGSVTPGIVLPINVGGLGTNGARTDAEIVTLIDSMKSATENINNHTPSLADIAGTWNGSEIINGLTDKVYSVITIDGTLTYYNDMGDSFDNIIDCYLKTTATIKDISNGVFLINNNISVRFMISNKSLIGTTDDEIEVSIPSSLQEADFTPLCNQI